VILFVATNPRVTGFWPNWGADERIGHSLLKAQAAGVEVRCIKVVLLEGGAVRLESPELAVNLSRSR
jgi:DNA-binding sugar fermentation-stimulating protein